MSSFKNAIQQKTHKERSQPAARSKWGLLEKKKDYVLRAQDYHKKEKALKILKDKADARNPDEFYFKMIRSSTRKGVHVQERNLKYDHELLQLLKTQDSNYIQYQKGVNLKKLEKLEEGLHLASSQSDTSRHTIFVDSSDQVKSFDPVQHFETTPELVDQPWNRLKKEILEKTELPTPTLEEQESLKKERRKRLLERSSRLDRHLKLRKVEQEQEIQKHLMGKGPRHKIGVDANGLPVYKWKPLRKK